MQQNVIIYSERTSCKHNNHIVTNQVFCDEKCLILLNDGKPVKWKNRKEMLYQRLVPVSKE